MEKACRFFMVLGFVIVVLSVGLAIHDYAYVGSRYGAEVLYAGRGMLYGLFGLLMLGVAAILYATRKR